MLVLLKPNRPRQPTIQRYSLKEGLLTQWIYWPHKVLNLFLQQIVKGQIIAPFSLVAIAEGVLLGTDYLLRPQHLLLTILLALVVSVIVTSKPWRGRSNKQPERVREIEG